jgi:hypothetical protein
MHDDRLGAEPAPSSAVTYSLLLHRLAHRWSLPAGRERAHERPALAGRSVQLRFGEAPVGIEPTNSRFADLGTLPVSVAITRYQWALRPLQPASRGLSVGTNCHLRLSFALERTTSYP